jgi:hypothetical protein
MATVVAPERKRATSGIEQERAWTRGSVWAVEFIRLKLGHDLEYARQLAETWKKVLDEEKKEGVVLSYKILEGIPSNRDDFTHMLMVEFPNFAALDQQDKMDAAVQKVFGSLGSMAETFRKREEIRESLGARLMRELHFKESGGS